MNNIVIHICTRDRPTEVSLLLQSLRTQTYKKFNILILDDGGGTPITNYYFVNYIINRMKLEGNDIKIIKNQFPSGVSKARQQLVEMTMKSGKEDYICRLDDDVILKEDYLEQLMKGINLGYDLMSGLTIPIHGPDVIRKLPNDEQILGECELNNKGELIVNKDSCGGLWIDKGIYLIPHFRSCALYKKKIHEAGVDYNSRLSKNGFREEQIISFKMILKGFKLGCNTEAINYHLLTPSGGERDTMNMTQFNQQIFEETTKRMWEDNGDFLKQYYEKNGIKQRVKSKGELLKNDNLIYKKEDINLLDEN